MGQGLIVALIGPDGSGKTTVGRRLLDGRLNLPAEYLYMGFNARHSNRLLPTTRLIEGVRARRGRRPGRAPEAPSAEITDTVRRGRRRGPLAVAMGTARLANRLAEEAYRQYLAGSARRAGRVVILDRDSLLDHHVANRAGRRQTLGRRIQGAFLRRFSRRPDLVVYLDAPPDVLMERKGEHTLGWLDERRRHYLAALELVPRHAVVDATRPLEQVTGEVAVLVEAAVAADRAAREHRENGIRPMAAAARAAGRASQVAGRMARHAARVVSSQVTVRRARATLAGILVDVDRTGLTAGDGAVGIGERPWRSEPLRVGRSSAVFRISTGGHPGARDLIVRVAHSRAAAASLAREADVCRRLASSAAVDEFRHLVPTVLAAGTSSGLAYVVERALPGRPAAAGRRPIATLDLGRAAEAIAMLHTATARRIEVGEQLIDEWVSSRLARVEALALRADPDGPWRAVIDRLNRLMLDDIGGRTMTVATIHGDYWADNLLVGDDGVVTGIVDWDSAGWEELPLHDPVHLVLRSQAATWSMPLGRIVRDMIDGRPWSASMERIVEPVRDGLDDRAVMLLYWLRAVTGSAERHPEAASEVRWIRAAILPPLAEFA